MDDADAAATTGTDGLVLFVDYQLPTPDRDSGSLRTIRMIEQLHGLGRQVLFFPLDGKAAEPYAASLRRSGVAIVPDRNQQVRFLREQGTRIALAVLCRPDMALQLLGEIRDYAPECVIAYDTVDVHFLRIQRQASLAEQHGRPERFRLRAAAATSRALELFLVEECDVTVVVSEDEQRLLYGLVPDADIEVVSNIHLPDGRRPEPPPSARLLFVGNYQHQPNVDAAQWLCREILPLVRREVPEATLDLVGSGASPVVAALAGEGVTIHGWVKDLGPLYAGARVAVAPLRYGAGVKGKVGEALEFGVPVVGTRIAFEGMGLVDGQHVLVDETAAGLAERMVRLIRDDELWRRLTRAAAGQLSTRFGPATARAALERLLDRCPPPGGVRTRRSRREVS